MKRRSHFQTLMHELKKKQRAVTKKNAFEITIIINQMKLLMYEG